MNFTVLRFDTIESTNDEALRQARAGAAEGLCIVADRQTAGRGRHGRAWVSAKGSGLYFSAVLRPRLDARLVPLITLMTGVAVHDTLQAFGLKPDIKWVNDVLIGDKKISGILAEAVETPSGLAVVVGIGINVTSADFPEDIAESATSIKAETRQTIAMSELEAALVRSLGYFYDMLTGEHGPAQILAEWGQRSSYFFGKSVRVVLGNEAFTGVTDGVEPTGALRVRTPDGEVRIVNAGDVQRLRSSD
jgi:BirA family transcriptional regulator, biotin operon repressor / biotin---[acetyl-CoA-carboxylase] ligase